MDIGHRMKELRIQYGLTQQELADRSELSKGFISQLERNLTSPSVGTLLDIIQCLGTTPAEFFTDQEPEQIVFKQEDYFIKEVIPLIDKEFNTIKTKEGRYIGGISAGGYAALHNSFRHQDLFSKVGGHMPAMELTLEEEDTPYFKDMSVWEKYDPITIAKNNEISKDIKVYLDAGNQDEGHFYEGCKVLQEILDKKQITSQNHIYEGHHNGEYIISKLEKYLEFYNS